MAAMVALGAVVSSRVLARRGARLPMLGAGLGLATGGVLLSQLTATSGPAPLAVAFVVFGIGGGLVNAPITYTAVSGMPVSQAGVASGIASTSRADRASCLGIAQSRGCSWPMGGVSSCSPWHDQPVGAGHDTAIPALASSPGPLRLLPRDLPQGP